MESSLFCNNLKCRAVLGERAITTTCSHILCIPCADELGLTTDANDQRNCPVCRTLLPNIDDVCNISRHLTEQYKASVLSGLDPTTIIECAGRALEFWTYQKRSEFEYQEYLSKSLKDNIATQKAQMDEIVHHANTEIDQLSRRLEEMKTERDKSRAENAILVGALKEKTRKQKQTQELYERLKHKEMTAATRSAAIDSADDVMRSVSGHSVDAGYGRAHMSHDNLMMGNAQSLWRDNRHRRQGSMSSGNSGKMMPPPQFSRLNNHPTASANQRTFRHSNESTATAAAAMATPQHRIPLGRHIDSFPPRSRQEQHANSHLPVSSNSYGRPLYSRTRISRHSNTLLQSGNGMASRTSTGYGLSGNMKVGSARREHGLH